MYSIDHHDLGTPEASGAPINLEIDGRPVTVPAGTSIMRAAALTGCDVPKLCATDTLEAFGSCRLCLVEIDGRAGTPASCTTPVAEGMRIHTQTNKLKSLRRGVMELYISDHPLDCLTCSANGDCELQDMAGAVGLREVRYGFDGANQSQVVFEARQRRHEDIQHARLIALVFGIGLCFGTVGAVRVAHFHAQRGAHHGGVGLELGRGFLRSHFIGGSAGERACRDVPWLHRDLRGCLQNRAW